MRNNKNNNLRSPRATHIWNYKSDLIFPQSVCEDEKNCFRSPANCADDSCSLMVGWKVAGDYVRFGATGAVTDSEKYLAVGFSLTGVMVSC